MFWKIEILLFILLIASALIALKVKDLLAAVVTLGAFSFLSALLYVIMGAVDVGFTEAVVGAGVSTVFFIVALHNSKRESVD